MVDGDELHVDGHVQLAQQLVQHADALAPGVEAALSGEPVAPVALVAPVARRRRVIRVHCCRGCAVGTWCSSRRLGRGRFVHGRWSRWRVAGRALAVAVAVVVELAGDAMRWLHGSPVMSCSRSAIGAGTREKADDREW